MTVESVGIAVVEAPVPRKKVFDRRKDQGRGAVDRRCQGAERLVVAIQVEQARLVVHRRPLRRTRFIAARRQLDFRSEEHTSELQSLMRISYAVFCLKKKKKNKHINTRKLYYNYTH